MPGTVQSASIEDLGNGITMETTTTMIPSIPKSNYVTAHREVVYRDNGTTIAIVTLSATFGYNGTLAWVVSASASHWVASGWTYENQSVTIPGASARVTASLRKWSGIILVASVSVDISLGCSPSGVIS
jgi:hypothetical protein